MDRDDATRDEEVDDATKQWNSWFERGFYNYFDTELEQLCDEIAKSHAAMRKEWRDEIEKLRAEVEQLKAEKQRRVILP